MMTATGQRLAALVLMLGLLPQSAVRYSSFRELRFAKRGARIGRRSDPVSSVNVRSLGNSKQTSVRLVASV